MMETQLSKPWASTVILSTLDGAEYKSVPTELDLSLPIGYEKKGEPYTICTPTLQPVTYSWENMQVYLQTNNANCISRIYKKSPPIHKRILDNVTGVVRPGEFLAIMGASGAGKTTLLNCLTFRNAGKLQILGQRYLNGANINTDTLARISGYVQQDDLFFSNLTVKEHLRFQALLRMDKHLSYKERMNRVEQVMHELGLKKCAKSLIGNPERGIKGISGGERKRLAFASEVLTNPSLLFCDEPTSGLDSYMAQNIVQVLKNLASSGKTVICTIHQPSSEVFAMFDRILLMAEGRTAFLGPASQAMDFFSNQGLPCPPNYNPADFFIHNLATVPDEETESKQRIKVICDAFESSDAGRLVQEAALANRLIPSDKNVTEEVDVERPKVKRSPYKAKWITQFRAVYWRSAVTISREPAIVKIKAFQTIFIAGLIALVFQGQNYEFRNIVNIQGALFILVTNMSFQNIFGVVNDFTGELPIFLREHFNGMYRADVYFLCKTMADLPIYILFPAIFVSIPYFAIGLNPEVTRYFTTVGIIIVLANVATSFGYLISCLAKSTQMALALGPMIMVPLFLFGGFFLRNGSVPVYFEWLRYLSWFMYANEALSINQWSGVSFNDTLSPCPDKVCEGDFILQQFDFNPDFFYRDIGCLFALIAGFRLLAFIALLIKTYRAK